MITSGLLEIAFIHFVLYDMTLNPESTFMLFSVSLGGSTSFYTSTLLPISKSGGPILSLVF